MTSDKPQSFICGLSDVIINKYLFYLDSIYRLSLASGFSQFDVADSESNRFRLNGRKHFKNATTPFKVI